MDALTTILENNLHHIHQKIWQYFTASICLTLSSWNQMWLTLDKVQMAYTAHWNEATEAERIRWKANWTATDTMHWHICWHMGLIGKDRIHTLSGLVAFCATWARNSCMISVDDICEWRNCHLYCLVALLQSIVAFLTSSDSKTLCDWWAGTHLCCTGEMLQAHTVESPTRSCGESVQLQLYFLFCWAVPLLILRITLSVGKDVTGYATWLKAVLAYASSTEFVCFTIIAFYELFLLTVRPKSVLKRFLTHSSGCTQLFWLT